MGVSFTVSDDPCVRRYLGAKVGFFRQIFCVEKLVRSGYKDPADIHRTVRAALTAARDHRANARAAICDAIARLPFGSDIWHHDLELADRSVRTSETTLYALLTPDRVADITHDPGHAQDYLQTIRMVSSQIFRPYAELLAELTASAGPAQGAVPAAAMETQNPAGTSH